MNLLHAGHIKLHGMRDFQMELKSAILDYSYSKQSVVLCCVDGENMVGNGDLC